MFYDVEKLNIRRCYVCQKSECREKYLEFYDSWLEVVFRFKTIGGKTSQTMIFHLECISPRFLQMIRTLESLRNIAKI